VALSADAGNALVGTLQAVGDVTVSAQKDIAAQRVASSQGKVAMSAGADGRIQVARLEANALALSSDGDINVDQIVVGTRLQLAARSFDGSVKHVDLDKPLKINAVGKQQALMERLQMSLDSVSGTNFEKLYAVDASLKVLSGTLNIADGVLSKRMTIANPISRLVMDNQDLSPQTPFDLQLFSRTGAYKLFLDRNILITEGADIIHRNQTGNTVQAVTTGLDSSVAEKSLDELAHAMRVGKPPALPRIQLELPLLEVGSGVVQLLDESAASTSEKNDDPKEEKKDK
jgi:hypothetical protein